MIEVLIRLGDKSPILAGHGSTNRTFGIRGLTAVLMILAAISMRREQAEVAHAISL